MGEKCIIPEALYCFLLCTAMLIFSHLILFGMRGAFSDFVFSLTTLPSSLYKKKQKAPRLIKGAYMLPWIGDRGLLLFEALIYKEKQK